MDLYSRYREPNNINQKVSPNLDIDGRKNLEMQNFEQNEISEDGHPEENVMTSSMGKSLGQNNFKMCGNQNSIFEKSIIYENGRNIK